jgi:hypothetical protein
VTTPLQRYIDAKRIPSARLEALLEKRLNRSPSSMRQQVYRWRRTGNIRRIDMVRLLWAVREATNDPTVKIDELFDFDPGNEANWND